MIVKFSFILLLKIAYVIANTGKKQSEETNEVIELTDGKWDQMQKGQWLIGFFGEETQSKELETQWSSVGLECFAQNINVGKVFAPDNPGLYIRFLVTVFPKVFYIKNGVAHELPSTDKEKIIEFIKHQKLNKLKPVNFLSNPFSLQMSLLSHLFAHAVRLYNFESAIVQKYIASPIATDFVFALTFIVVGTFLGLFMTCIFGLIQILFLMDSKESEAELDNQKKDRTDSDDEKEKETESSEKLTVRKRK